MNEQQNFRKELDNALDWLSEQPEEFIRGLFSNKRIPRNVDFIQTIGGTEYTVVSHFKLDSAEDIMQKVIRLLEDEAIV